MPAEAATGTHDQPVPWSCGTCLVKGVVYRQPGEDAGQLQVRLDEAHLEVSPRCSKAEIRVAQAAYPD